jgi:hypothetical protein
VLLLCQATFAAIGPRRSANLARRGHRLVASWGGCAERRTAPVCQAPALLPLLSDDFGLVEEVGWEEGVRVLRACLGPRQRHRRRSWTALVASPGGEELPIQLPIYCG